MKIAEWKIRYETLKALITRSMLDALHNGDNLTAASAQSQLQQLEEGAL